MKKNYNLLLMTGTIKPDNSILKKGYKKDIEVNNRLKQYVSSILYYLNIENIHGIVFIDSSNYNFDTIEFESIKRLSKILGKDIELLSFKQDIDKLNKYNYGYGEFQILEYFSKKSKLLNKVDNFYKVTGRYKVYNIKKIINKTEKKDNLFYKFNILDFDTLATSFFKINKQNLNFLSKNYNGFYKKYKINNFKYFGAENIFFDIFYKKNKLNSLKNFPHFHYLSNKNYFLYNFLLKIGIIDINNFFTKILIKLYSFLDVNKKIKYLKFISSISNKILNIKTK